MTPTKNESLPELPDQSETSKPRYVLLSADLWWDHWFRAWPEDVRKKLSHHDLQRMYRAVIELTTPPDPLAREAPTEGVASNDTLCMEWLERHLVEVREPLRYGSAHMFYALQVNDEGEPYRSDLRQRVLGYAMTATPPAPQRMADGGDGQAYIDGKPVSDDYLDGFLAGAAKAPLFAPQRLAQGDGCGACGDACADRGSCQVADDSPPTQPPRHDREEVEKRTEESVGQYDPHAPPHCPTCECCARKTGGDQGAMDAKRWRDLTAGWGGMQERVDGRVFMHISTPQWEVPKDCRDIGDAFDRRYELDNAAREKAGE